MGQLRRLPLTVLLAACVLGACNRGDEKGENTGPAKMDTTNSDWQDGLSAEQVEEDARALTPEQAARAGISVDTTIHLENLGPEDSAARTGDTTATDTAANRPPTGVQQQPPPR